MLLEETLRQITPCDEQARQQAQKRWNSVGKPLHSLGKLEDLLIDIAGIQQSAAVHLDRKALVIMCADNGIVEEGVTQTGQEVTATVAGNFPKGKSCSAIMCRKTKTDLFPVDVGMVTDVDGVQNRKIRYGTGNFVRERAMSREEAVRAVETGIEQVRWLKDKGYDIIAGGEMGIGNTTTSSAVVSVLMQLPPEQVTGRGAGLSSEGLTRKIEAIKKGIRKHQPDPKDPIDVLSAVGGLDLAALTGLFLGGAACHVPVVMDGFITAAAALAAVRLAPDCRDYILASHVSNEPATRMIMKELEKSPCLECGMHLGEGTGAVALFPLLDLAAAIYHEMGTFEDIQVEAYRDLK